VSRTSRASAAAGRDTPGAVSTTRRGQLDDRTGEQCAQAAAHCSVSPDTAERQRRY